MMKINHFGIWIIPGAFFIVLLIKAFILPVVCDESITAVIFVNYKVWDIMMYTDHYPNNHILNTLITKLLAGIFGNQQLVIRIPNLLSFLLYCWGVYKILNAVFKRESVLYLPAMLLFICNPYLLDYFGLCRGYGMSSALAIVSLSYLISGFKNTEVRDIWIAFVLSILASYANFTLLVFWAAVIVFTGFYFIMHSENFRALIKPFLLLLFSNALYVALIANPLIRMHDANEFQFWTSGGFYKETILPLIAYSHSGSGLIPGVRELAVLVFMTIGANLLFLLVRLIKLEKLITLIKRPQFVITGILLLTAIINILQCWIMKTPNLHGRTALFFYPLFIAVFVGFLGIIPELKFRFAQKVVAIAFAVICIYHVADRFRMNWVRDGYQSVNTFEVLDYLKTHEPNKPVSLEAYWYLYHSFNYYVFTGKVPWLKLEFYDEKVDTTTNADYYYIFSSNFGELESRYECVKEISNDRMLLKRKRGV
jgi:hypothetical protein